MKMAMVKNPPEQVEAWWQDYRKTRSENARNRLMENYLHIVKYSAERLHTKLPEEVEVDDLISAGIFGLMDAVAAFDPTRGVKFETYCAAHPRRDPGRAALHGLGAAPGRSRAQTDRGHAGP